MHQRLGVGLCPGEFDRPFIRHAGEHPVTTGGVHVAEHHLGVFLVGRSDPAERFLGLHELACRLVERTLEEQALTAVGQRHRPPDVVATHVGEP